MIDEQAAYGFRVELNGNFDAIMTRVLDALKAEGFQILGDIDLRAVVEPGGATIPGYHMISVCDPKLALAAVQAEPDIGLLVPSKVVVRMDPNANKVVVVFSDCITVLALTNNPEITTIGWEERSRLERVRDALVSRP